MMRQRITQIIQHPSPGGLECLVLDLAQHSRAPTTIIALEGSKDEAIAAWPRLAPLPTILCAWANQTVAN